MAERDIETLRRARENAVRKRRAMAEQMVPRGAAMAHFAPNFSELQAVIDAIDRAIEDEARLPPDYGADDEEPQNGSEPDRPEGSNVVDVDFETA